MGFRGSRVRISPSRPFFSFKAFGFADSTSISTIAEAIAVLVALFVLFGCERAPPSVVILDLASSLATARVHRERAGLDLGTPEARAALVHGWSRADGARNGDTFVSSAGPESALDFFLVEPRNIEVSLRGLPIGSSGSIAHAVTLAVNETDITAFAMEPGWHSYRVEIPKSRLRRGLNRLVLRYEYAPPRPPALGKSGRSRQAVIWDRLGYSPTVGGDARVRQVESGLVLPYGSRVEYYFRARRASLLILDGLQRIEGGQGQLEIEIAREGSEPTIVLLGTQRRTASFELGSEGGLVRLSVSALPRIAGADGELLLVRPRVAAPLSLTGTDTPRGSSVAPPTGRPNIIVYLVDTLRADRLGCYGYSRPLSPNIDAFAAEATLFENAVAQSPWTRPSVVSVFTGLWPRSHGVNGPRDRLAVEATTLAEVLREDGYATVGFIAQPNVARRFGLNQRFDTYRLHPRSKTSGRRLNEAFENWLDSRAAGDQRPIFLYLHTVEPHSPYNPPAQYRQRFAAGVKTAVGKAAFLKAVKRGEIPVTESLVGDLTALYDAEVAFSDATFGALVEILKQRGLYDNSIVIFLSDHGEEFNEHGRWEHGKSLHGQLLDVPLIIRFPDFAHGRRVEAPVQHIDVLPTLLDYVGLETPRFVQGNSLLALLTGTGEPGEVARQLYSFVDLGGIRATSVTNAEWRLILPDSPRFGFASELYDRRVDREERRNLASERPIVAGHLETLLAARVQEDTASLEGGEAELDEEMTNRLRAMGYLN